MDTGKDLLRLNESIDESKINMTIFIIRAIVNSNTQIYYSSFIFCEIKVEIIKS